MPNFDGLKGCPREGPSSAAEKWCLSEPFLRPWRGHGNKDGFKFAPFGRNQPVDHAFSMMCHQLTVDYSYVFFIFFPQGSHRQLPMATWERLKPRKVLPVWWFTPLWYPWIHRLTVYEAPFLWENSDGIPLMYTRLLAGWWGFPR